MATTPLSQAVLAGMDPNIYGSLQRMQTGQQLSEQGMDSSPTTKLGAVARLAQALAGSYVSNGATSELAKTIAGGKKSATDQLMEALQSQKAPVPVAPPALAAPPPSPAAPPMQPASAPVATSPIQPDPGSPNAQVAARFPAEMSPGSAASPLPPNTPSPLDTAQYPAGPVGAPDAATATAAAAQPRGIRNNNPLNIEAGDFTKGQPGFAGSDGRFAKFETPEHGLAAAHKLLDIYDQKHGLNTVAGIVGRWAPQADGNNTMAYAADVAGKLGIDPNAPVPPAMRPQLIAAMAQHENGAPVPGADQMPYKVAGPAVAAPVASATAADDAELPAAAAATAGQQPTPAAGGGIDVHRLMAVLQNPYSDDATKALASKLLLQHLTPENPEFKEVTQPDGTKRQVWVNPKEQTVTPVVGQASASPVAGLQGKEMLDELKRTDPAQHAQVQAVLENRAPYPTGSRLNPQQQRLKEMVTLADPNFNAQEYAARGKLLSSFRAGKDADEIKALNTVSGHLSDLSKAATELGNTNYPMVNSAVNWFRENTGDPRMNRFGTALHGVVDELSKAYRGGVISDAEARGWSENINAAKSPEQLHGVIGQMADMLQSKIQASKQKYEGMGEHAPPIQTVNPHAQEAFDRLPKLYEEIRARGRGEKPMADTGVAPKAAAAPAVAPEVGAVMKGHKFLGGDPASPDSWQKVQ